MCVTPLDLVLSKHKVDSPERGTLKILPKHGDAILNPQKGSAFGQQYDQYAGQSLFATALRELAQSH